MKLRAKFFFYFDFRVSGRFVFDREVLDMKDLEFFYVRDEYRMLIWIYRRG